MKKIALIMAGLLVLFLTLSVTSKFHKRADKDGEREDIASKAF
jgi:hypothetical protein